MYVHFTQWYSNADLEMWQKDERNKTKKVWAMTPIALLQNLTDEIHARIHAIHACDGMWDQHSIPEDEIWIKIGIDAGGCGR